MPFCGLQRSRSETHQILTLLVGDFQTLKKKEKAGCYNAKDGNCKTAVQNLIRDLQRLIELEKRGSSKGVLGFEIRKNEEIEEHENSIREKETTYQSRIDELSKNLKKQEENHEQYKIRVRREEEKKELHASELQEKVVSLNRKIQEDTNKIKELNCKVEQLEHSKKALENENKSLNEKIREETKEIEELKCEVQMLENAKKDMESEKNRCISDTEKLKSKMEELENDSKRLQKSTQQEKEKDISQINWLKSEVEKLEDAKKTMENENKMLFIDAQNLGKELHDAEQTKKDFLRNLRESSHRVKTLESKISELQYEINQARSNLQMQRNNIDRLQKNLAEEKRAKEHALNRLSAAAAHRLRDQNPGITDLSDPNRPLKLAEKVSELYDNEWTNAMENLENLDIQEEKGIKVLLKIIKSVFDTCVDFGDTHLESFPDLLALPPVIYQLQKERVLSVKDMSSEMLKPMKDFRKSNAEHAISRLQKYIAAQRKSKLKINQKVYDSCKEYIEKCVELCWMMRIQDPPIYMEADYQTNSAFDSNKMRSYTKAGKLVHFVVWPTFFLHKDGPLLAKGVVQGSKSEIAEEESSHSSADETDDDEKYEIAPTVSSDHNKSRTADVSDRKQFHSGNGKLPNDNITTIDTECLENTDKGGDQSPAGSQSDQGNGEQTTDKSNTTIETSCSETDGKGQKEDDPQIIESNPEKNKLPNNNSNSSNGNNCNNGEGDDVAGLGNDVLRNTSIGTKNSENDGEGEDDDDKATGLGEKVEGTKPFTDEQEIDL